MTKCIVWKKVRRGFIVIGMLNTLIFASLIALYFVFARMLIDILKGVQLVIALSGSGLGIVFVSTFVFHVAVDAFRRMKKFDSETRRGLEICV